MNEALLRAVRNSEDGKREETARALQAAKAALFGTNAPQEGAESGGGKFDREMQAFLRAEQSRGNGTGLTEALFPNAKQMQPQGANGKAGRVLVGALDVMDLPKRALGTLRDDQKVSDSDSNILRPEMEQVKEIIDESDVPGVEAHREVQETEPPEWAGDVTDMAQGLARAMKPEDEEQAVKDLSKGLVELVGNFAGDPLVAVGLLKNALGKVAQVGGKGLVKGASKLSGFSPDELRNAQGMKKFAQARGSSGLLGDAIELAIDHGGADILPFTPAAGRAGAITGDGLAAMGKRLRESEAEKLVVPGALNAGRKAKGEVEK